MKMHQHNDDTDDIYSAEAFMGVPTSGTNNRPPCASKLCGHMPKNFERNGGGGISGLISFAAYLWNTILHPPGLPLQCLGWYRAYLEIWSSWGC